MHIPIMLFEIKKYIHIFNEGIYIDATFGYGGHSKVIIENLNKNGLIYIFDRDINSTDIAKFLFHFDNRVNIYNKTFSEIYNIIAKHKILGKINGIVLDLGLSSNQITDFEKGLSFKNTMKIDMRLNKNTNINAYDFLNNYSYNLIKCILIKLIDNKLSSKIAKFIINYRKTKPILYTTDLVKILYNFSFNNYKKNNIISKVFQAIKLYINNDFFLLLNLLNMSLSLLSRNGILIIISFNSLEDKIIKLFLKKNSKSFYNFKLKQIKCIRPGLCEINFNIKSRSAVMRIIKKIE